MQNTVFNFFSNPARLRSLVMYVGLSVALILMAALMPRKEEEQKDRAPEKQEKKEIVAADISDRLY